MTSKTEKKKDGPVKQALAILILVGGAYFMWQVLSLSFSDPKECSASDSMASIMAANFVKRELTAPDSANFGPHNQATIVDIGPCRYRVTNHVDAQNGFGATVRQKFTIEMSRSEGTNNWSATGLTFH